MFAEEWLREAYQSLQQDRPADAFEIIEKTYTDLLNDSRTNFGTQVYAWLSELLYEEKKQSKSSWENAIWKLIRSRIESGVSEDEQVDLICGLLAPILEEPRDMQTMGRVMAIYQLNRGRPIVEEAYRSVDPVPDLEQDLARYPSLMM